MHEAAIAGIRTHVSGGRGAGGPGWTDNSGNLAFAFQPPDAVV